MTKQDKQDIFTYLHTHGWGTYNYLGYKLIGNCMIRIRCDCGYPITIYNDTPKSNYIKYLLDRLDIIPESQINKSTVINVLELFN